MIYFISTSLNVTGEIYHKIEHCLIGNGNLDEIDTVFITSIKRAMQKVH